MRVHDQQALNVPGAGIGLALVKELVENADGSIELISCPGQGSEFIVSLPIAEKVLVASRPAHALDKGELEKDVLSASMKHIIDVGDVEEDNNKALVLVIEDHPDMRAFIGQSLNPNFRCIFASDGGEGIKKAMEYVPDLIVTDLMMPVKDGYQVAAILRDDERTSHIPIIMLTARGDDESRLQAWKREIDEYLEKPFNAEELRQRSQSLLRIRARLIASEQTDAVVTLTEEQQNSGLSERDSAFIVKLEQVLAQYYSDPDLNAEAICGSLAMSERQLQRKIKALLGKTFGEYLRLYRLKQSTGKLLSGQPVTLVAMESGFGSQSYFSQCFKLHFGMSPRQYQNLNHASED